MKNIIEVKNLTKKYGTKKAIDDLSFNVEKGILFSFLGSNGAGKTTTISILTTLLKRDKGHILIDDIRLDDDNVKIREKIGIVFQDSYLDDQLTVYENLEIRGSFYYKNKEELTKKVNKALKLLKLETYATQKYGTLSGGERRRVDIARALLHEPKILFLDEPTTGLDPYNRRLVWETIKKLQIKKNITVFLTTHYMEEADQSDCVGIIDKGKLIAYDTPHNLKLTYSKNLLKLTLKNENDKSKIKEKFNAVNGELLIRVKNSLEALDIAYKYQKLIADLQIVSGNMDDVFLNITGSKIRNGD